MIGIGIHKYVNVNVNGVGRRRRLYNGGVHCVVYNRVYIYVCVQPTVEDQKLAIKVRGPRHLVSFLHQPYTFFFKKKNK